MLVCSSLLRKADIYFLEAMMHISLGRLPQPFTVVIVSCFELWGLPVLNDGSFYQANFQCCFTFFISLLVICLFSSGKIQALVNKPFKNTAVSSGLLCVFWDKAKIYAASKQAFWILSLPRISAGDRHALVFRFVCEAITGKYFAFLLKSLVQVFQKHVVYLPDGTVNFALILKSFRSRQFLLGARFGKMHHHRLWMCRCGIFSWSDLVDSWRNPEKT